MVCHDQSITLSLVSYHIRFAAHPYRPLRSLPFESVNKKIIFLENIPSNLLYVPVIILCFFKKLKLKNPTMHAT